MTHTERLALDCEIQLHIALDRVLAERDERAPDADYKSQERVRHPRFVPRDGTQVDERVFRAALDVGRHSKPRRTATRSPR